MTFVGTKGPAPSLANQEGYMLMLDVRDLDPDALSEDLRILEQDWYVWM